MFRATSNKAASGSATAFRSALLRSSKRLTNVPRVSTISRGISNSFSTSSSSSSTSSGLYSRLILGGAAVFTVASVSYFNSQRVLLDDGNTKTKKSSKKEPVSVEVVEVIETTSKGEPIIETVETIIGDAADASALDKVFEATSQEIEEAASEIAQEIEEEIQEMTDEFNKDIAEHEREQNELAASSSSNDTPTPQVEGEEGEQPPQNKGAYDPDTGEINWDCPCLGGMANGPCGEEFKEAFSCFVYSTAEPKGVDCIQKFSNMQECFRRHPEVYAEELREAEPFPEDEKNEQPVDAASTEPNQEETPKPSKSSKSSKASKA